MEVEDGVGLERVKSTAELSGPLRQVGARMLDAHFVKWAKAIEDISDTIGRDLGEPIGRLPRLLHGRAREARCTQLFGQRVRMAARA